MCESLIWRDIRQFGSRASAERAAARREDESAHVLNPLAAQGLRQGRMLAVDRDDLTRLGCRRHQFAAASVEPAARAASVGSSPTAPVMPLSTTSQGVAAASVAAVGPISSRGTAWSPSE